MMLILLLRPSSSEPCWRRDEGTGSVDMVDPVEMLKLRSAMYCMT